MQLKMPGGFSLELGYGRAGPAVACRLASRPASARVVPGFMLASRAAVDDRYARVDRGGLPRAAAAVRRCVLKGE